MIIKNEKGITLIALVITIIVTLILASIAISAAIGENGVLKNTKEATIRASIREIQEALDTYILLKEKEAIENGNYDTTSIDLSDVLTLRSGVTYTVNLDKLNIKGDYGKGISVDIFIAEKTTSTEYTVFYIDEKGIIYSANGAATP